MLALLRRLSRFVFNRQRS